MLAVPVSQMPSSELCCFRRRRRKHAVGGGRRAAGGVLRRCYPVISRRSDRREADACWGDTGGCCAVEGVCFGFNRRSLESSTGRRRLTGAASRSMQLCQVSPQSHTNDSSGFLPLHALFNSQIFFFFVFFALAPATASIGSSSVHVDERATWCSPLCYD